MSSTVVEAVTLTGLYATLWIMFRWVCTARAPWVVRALGSRWSRLRERRRPQPARTPPILYALELRRLGEGLQRESGADTFSKAERIAASQLAYDHALRDYCRSVDLPVPEGYGSLSRNQRFELEFALLTSGHDW